MVSRVSPYSSTFSTVTVPASEHCASLQGLIEAQTMLENMVDSPTKEHVNQLPSNLREELAFALWIAHGSPDIEDYGNQRLLSNPNCITETSPPILFSQGSSLILQLLHRIQMQQRITYCKYYQERLATLESIPLIFENLQKIFPEKSQEELNTFLQKNPSSDDLKRLRESYYQEEMQLFDQQKEEQKTAFYTLYKNGQFTHRQLHALYQRLPDEVKRLVPSPPYYGHGINCSLYQKMGAHLIKDTKGYVSGVRFRLHAPLARQVGVKILHGSSGPDYFFMNKISDQGIWEVQADCIGEGAVYEYHIETLDGRWQYKSDPFARNVEQSERLGSIVVDPASYVFSDHHWMEQRTKQASTEKPILIFEMHPASFTKWGDKFKNYKEIGRDLVFYCKEMGYSHVQMMGVFEHTFLECWGYQPTHYFAPTTRYGSFQDFQAMVEHLHQNGIGIILDTPLHFSKHEKGLRHFSGTDFFEDPSPKNRETLWDTLLPDFKKRGVQNFFISSLFSFIDECHIDGFRFDAIAHLFDLSHGKNPDTWEMRDGTHENLGAIEFFRNLSTCIHKKYPGVLLIAEDPTLYPSAKPIEHKGLGCDYKLNMGGHYDLFHVLCHGGGMKKLRQLIQDAAREHRVFAFSHDDEVHGKGTYFDKMPGDSWQKFARVRLMFGVQMALPGPKADFMGFGRQVEWDVTKEIEWPNKGNPRLQQLHHMKQELNRLYVNHPALWTSGLDGSYFRFIAHSDTNNHVISYHRGGGKGEQLAVIHNFSDHAIHDYQILFPHQEHIKNLQDMKILFNSDAPCFGGSDFLKKQPTLLYNEEGSIKGFAIDLPPLATVILQESFA